MKLEGSCHCRAVRFSLESDAPVPFQRCYCGICRKAGGGGGYLINLGGHADTLQVTGREHVRVYRATVERDGKRMQSDHERHFCQHCGTHLWAFNPRWPELVHPVAGAIDTPLPVPPHTRHMMVGSKANWLEIHPQPDDVVCDAYPDTSLADWHKAHYKPDGA